MIFIAFSKGEDERYDLYKSSDIEGTIYEHCTRAIDKAINLGEHGIPKIGSGDWNDGFNLVGNKGRGESIWLGFFLYIILQKLGWGNYSTTWMALDTKYKNYVAIKIQKSA